MVVISSGLTASQKIRDTIFGCDDFETHLVIQKINK
jgi:hypothetical protein